MNDTKAIFVPLGSRGLSRIEKVLIANRGEIATRICQTLRSMSIRSVGVFAFPDAEAPFTELVDELYCLDGSTAAETYLDIDKLIACALLSGADAVHPGYGFLSESAEFAARVEQEGLIWIGPAPQTISDFGDKRNVKVWLAEHAPEVPLIPGLTTRSPKLSELCAVAARVGFPVMLKATCGGGGKGLRVVRREEDLASAVTSVQNEAKSSFGDSSFLLEKYFTSVQHIEVQIVGDRYGNVVALGERNCSIQRRHQKLVEEAPSPGLSEELRTRMSAVAVRIGKLARYAGAGTVEFVVDVPTQQFYFLEVNTRLQVEHRVTEQVNAGIDLVRAQVLVAMGYNLHDAVLRFRKLNKGILASDVTLYGHSIECRLCAEVPSEQFMPATGRILLFRPASVPGVSFDSAIRTGSDVGVHFDSMVCKVVASAVDRAGAVARMIVALEQTVVMGVRTNKHFLLDVLRNDVFASGLFDTHFVAEHFPPKLLKSAFQRKLAAPAVQAELVLLALLATVDSAPLDLLRWSNAMTGLQDFTCSFPWLNDDPVCLSYSCVRLQRGVGVELSGKLSFPSDASSNDDCSSSHADVTCAMRVLSDGGVRLVLDGKRAVPAIVRRESDGVVWVFSNLLLHSVLVRTQNRFHGAVGEEDTRDKQRLVVAPMPSRVMCLHKRDGDVVKKGDLLCTVESMKMEVKMHAAAAGVVELFVKEGQVVKANTALMRVVDPNTALRAKL